MIDPRVLRGDPCPDAQKSTTAGSHSNDDYVPSPTRPVRKAIASQPRKSSNGSGSRPPGGDAPPRNIEERVARALCGFVDMNDRSVTLHFGPPGQIKVRVQKRTFNLLSLMRF
jgi:hypothetical protein